MKWMKSCFATYKGLPKSIYVIFFASIINNMGNFVGLFLTLFLTNKIGMDIGLVGTIVCINAILGMVGAIIGGKIIDSFGRKKILIVSRLICAFTYIICAFTTAPIWITALLMFSSFIGGLAQPVYGTMITDLTEGEQRDTGFSLHYIAINVGSSVGPLLAGFLYENYLIGLFLGDALTTIISVLMIAIHVPETKPQKTDINVKVRAAEKAEEGSLLSAMLKRPTLLIFSGIIVIYFIVFSQFNFGLSLQVTDVFKSGGAKIFGILIAINSVMCSILTVFINAITQKYHAALSIAIGGIFYMVGFGMMFIIDGFWMFVLSTVIWTLGEILVSTKTGVYIANHTPISHRGRFNAVFPIIRRLGFAVGPIMAGFFVKYTGIRYLWLLIGGMALSGAIMMYVLYRKDKVCEGETDEQIA